MKTMKNKTSLFLLACLFSVAMVFSCAKTEQSGQDDAIQTSTEDSVNADNSDIPEEEKPILMVFGATIYDGDDSPGNAGATEFSGEGSKTQLGSLADGKYPNYWSDGDAVSINGVSSGSLSTGDGYVGTKRARFPMRQKVEQYDGNWFVGYPAGQFSAFSEGEGTVTIPTEQNYVPGSYDARSFILVGKSKTEEVTFYPQVAMLRVTPRDAAFPLGVNVRSVTLAAIGGEQMSGTFTTDYSDGSLTASSGASYITITADGEGVSFGTPFFFMIPEGTYAGGIRFTITTTDDRSMSFSNTGSYTASAGVAAKNITAPAFVESTLAAPTLTEITPSSIAVSWHGVNTTNDQKKAWRFHLYSDSGCTTQVREVNLVKEASCWKNDSGSLVPSYPICFALGGLNPGGTYYVKVRDVPNDVLSPATTITLSSSCGVQEMPNSISAVADAVFTEDFSILGWGPAEINGFDIKAGGYYPSTSHRATFNDFTTDAGTQYVRFNREWRLATSELNAALTASRLDDWLFSGYVLSCAGYLKVGNSGNVGHVLTPSFPVPSGKFAKVDVTINAARFDESAGTSFAIAVVSSATADSYHACSSFTWPADDGMRYQTVTIPNTTWSEVKVEGLYVRSGDRIVFGPLNGASASAATRVLLSSIKVDVTDIYDYYDIHDETTLNNFKTYIATNTSADAMVTADFSMSNAWASIPTAYTGTIYGCGHTITGLSAPLFDNFKGTIRHLKLNATPALTPASNSHIDIGIFANKMTSSANLYDCTSLGTVTCSYTAAVSEQPHIGGMVGLADSGSTLSNCINQASVTVSNTASSSYAYHIGGVAGRAISSSFSKCSNSGNVSNSAATSGTISIGGLCGSYYQGSISSSHNTGTVGNSGASTAGNPGLRQGGLIGWADSNVTMSGTSSAYNYNNGSVSNTSASTNPAVGGICGYVNNAGTTLAYSQNKSAGSVVLTLTGKTVSTVSEGGIVGYCNQTGGCVLNNTENAANLTLTGATVNSQFFVGGIIGRNAATSGTISNANNSGGISISSISSSSTSYSYVGGVSGGDGTATYSTCSNEGNIAVTVPVHIRVGGILGYAGSNPTGSSCEADITVASSNAAGSEVGGIAGYLNNTSAKVSMTYIGTIDASGCTVAPYVGGLIGANKSSCTFNKCQVGGTIKGSSTANYLPGLFCSMQAGGMTISFGTGDNTCWVKSGTVYYGTSSSTITADGQLNAGNLVGYGANSVTVSGSPSVK